MFIPTYTQAAIIVIAMEPMTILALNQKLSQTFCLADRFAFVASSLAHFLKSFSRSLCFRFSAVSKNGIRTLLAPVC